MKNFIRKNSSPLEKEYDLPLDSLKSKNKKLSFRIKVLLSIGFLIALLIFLGLLIWFYPHFFFSPKTVFAYVEGKEINRNIESVNSLLVNDYTTFTKKILEEPSKISYKISNINLKNTNIVNIPQNYLSMLKYANISGELEIDCKNNQLNFNTSIGLQSFKLFNINIFQNQSDLGFYSPLISEKNIVIDRTNLKPILEKLGTNIPVKKFQLTEFINNIILNEDEIKSLKDFFKFYPEKIFEYINPTNFEYFNSSSLDLESSTIDCKKIVFKLSKEELKKLHIYSLDTVESSEVLNDVLGARINHIESFLNDFGLYSLEDNDTNFYKSLISRNLIDIKNSNDLSKYYDIDYEVYFDKTYNLIGRKLILKNEDTNIWELLYIKSHENNDIKHSLQLKNKFKSRNIVFYENKSSLSSHNSLDMVNHVNNIKVDDIFINYNLNPLNEFSSDASYNHEFETSIFGKNLKSKISQEMTHNLEPKLNNLSTKGNISNQLTIWDKNIDINFAYTSSLIYGANILPSNANGTGTLRLNEAMSNEDLNELYEIVKKLKNNIYSLLNYI